MASRMRTRDRASAVAMGPELITNGGFDADASWTKGTGWTIGSGVATHAAGTASSITQGTATANRSYRVTWTITGWVAGTTWALVGGSASGGVSGNGTYSYVVKAAAAQAIGISCAATFNGSIDNVSVREVQSIA